MILGENIDFYLEAVVDAADIAGLCDDLVAFAGEVFEARDDGDALIIQACLRGRRGVEQVGSFLMGGIEACFTGVELGLETVAILDELAQIPIFDGEPFDGISLFPDFHAKEGLGFAQQVHFAGGVTHALVAPEDTECLGNAGEEVTGGGHGKAVLMAAGISG